MLTEIYIEAPLVDEGLADQVWEAWYSGEIETIEAPLALNPLFFPVIHKEFPDHVISKRYAVFRRGPGVIAIPRARHYSGIRAAVGALRALQHSHAVF